MSTRKGSLSTEERPITAGVTVVLNAFARPRMLPEQVAALERQTVPVDDIFVWQNPAPGVQSEWDFPDRAVVVRSNFNFKYHGRFALALLARTEYVCLLDDDILPGSRWIENCLATMAKKPGILGGVGIQLLGRDYRPFLRVGWPEPNEHIEEVDLVGHAWFLRREWLHYLWMEDPLSWASGEDIALAYLAQKYGRIPSLIPPHPVDQPELWSNTAGADPGSDEFASWRTATHATTRDECVRRALAGGWRLRRQTALGAIRIHRSRLARIGVNGVVRAVARGARDALRSLRR